MAKDLGFCRVKGFGIPDAPEVEKAPAPRPVAWDDINTAEKCLLFRYIESGGEELSLTRLEKTVPEMVQARRELYRTMIRRYEGALTRHFEADVATEIVAGLTTIIEMAVVEKVRTAIAAHPTGGGLLGGRLYCTHCGLALRPPEGEGSCWSCGAENPTMRRGSRHGTAEQQRSALMAALHQVGVLDTTKPQAVDTVYPGWWVVQTPAVARFVHHNPHHDVLGGFWTEPHIPTAMSRAAAQRRCDAWNSIVLDPRNGLDPVQDLGRVVELDSSRRVAEEQLRQGHLLADDEDCMNGWVEFRAIDPDSLWFGRVLAGQVRGGRTDHGVQEVAVVVRYDTNSEGLFWVPRARCIVPSSTSTLMPIGRG